MKGCELSRVSIVCLLFVSYSRFLPDLTYTGWTKNVQRIYMYTKSELSRLSTLFAWRQSQNKSVAPCDGFQMIGSSIFFYACVCHFLSSFFVSCLCLFQREKEREIQRDAPTKFCVQARQTISSCPVTCHVDDSLTHECMHSCTHTCMRRPLP